MNIQLKIEMLFIIIITPTPPPIKMSFQGTSSQNTSSQPETLERTGYQEMWYDQEPEHITNMERVIREIMLIYKLDREGATKKLEQMANTAVVEYF